MSSPFTLTIDWLAFTLPAGSAQDTMRMLEAAPWRTAVDPVEGVIIHDDPMRMTRERVRGVDGFAGRTR